MPASKSKSLALVKSAAVSEVAEVSPELAAAFPKADPGLQPLGSRLLVQIRSPMLKSAGGILLSNSDQETERWNTQIGRIIAIGPLAFKNRNDLAPWPEGEWCLVGDYVRVPKYGGDRWVIDAEDGSDVKALFVLFNDLELLGKVTTDPLKIKAFF